MNATTDKAYRCGGCGKLHVSEAAVRECEADGPVRTPSAKLNRLIDLAHDGGLEVEVEDHSEGILDSWTVVIRMPRWDAAHALAGYQNAKSIRIHALRIRGPRAFKLHVHEWGCTLRARDIQVRVLPYTIRGYISDVEGR